MWEADYGHGRPLALDVGDWGGQEDQRMDIHLEESQ